MAGWDLFPQCIEAVEALIMEAREDRTTGRKPTPEQLRAEHERLLRVIRRSARNERYWGGD
jgi:hypothetical protein